MLSGSNGLLLMLMFTRFRFQKTKIPLVVQGRRELRGTTLVAGEWSWGFEPLTS